MGFGASLPGRLPEAHPCPGGDITQTERSLMRLLLPLMLLLTPALAFADDARPEKAQFIIFGDQLIDGQLRRPQATWTNARQAANFARLLELKKSFLPAMQATSADPVFR